MFFGAYFPDPRPPKERRPQIFRMGSDIEVDIDFTRFDQLLVSDPNITAAELQKLMQEHPSFSKIYFDHVMPKEDDIEIISGDEEKRYRGNYFLDQAPAHALAL